MSKLLRLKACIQTRGESLLLATASGVFSAGCLSVLGAIFPGATGPLAKAGLFDPAVGLVLIGIGLGYAAVSCGCRRLAGAIGGGVFLSGAAAVMRCVDPTVFRGVVGNWIQGLGSGLGSPNTAAGVALCGISLIVMSLRAAHPRIAKALAASLLALGGLSLGGRLAGVEWAFDSGNLSGVVLLAALAFIATGTAQMVWAVEQARKQGRLNVWSLPFFMTGLAVILIHTGGVYVTTSAQRLAYETLSKSDQILKSLHLIKEDLATAESAVRGFILGQHDYSFARIVDTLDRQVRFELDHLQELAEGDALKFRRACELRLTVEKRLSFMQQGISDEARSMEELMRRTRVAKELMGEVWALSDLMLANEEAVRAQRLRQNDVRSEQLRRTTVMGCAVVILLFGLAIGLTYEAETKRRLAELKLLGVNHTLEEKVATRAAELQQASARAQKTSERLQTVLANSPIVLWVMDPRGRFTLIEGKGGKEIRLEANKLLGTSQPDLVRPYSEESYENSLRALNGESLVAVSPHRDRWFQTSYTPVKNAQGELVEVVGVSIDVTETETRERKFKFLANVIPQIMWTATPEGKADYYNQRWYDYTGLTTEQSEHSEQGGWKQVIHPEDLDTTAEKWTHAHTTGTPHEVECRFKRASDGTYRWHLIRAFPQRSEAGNIIQWFGTCTDIHEQKLAAERLEQRVAERTAELDHSRKRLRQITDCLPVLVAYVDREERYQFTNQTYKTWFGVEPESLIGRTLREVIDGQSYAEIEPSVARVLQGERVFFEREFLLKGMNRFVRREYVPDFQGGKVIGFYVMVTDLTERRVQEKLIQESEQRFRNTFEYAGTGMAIVGLDGRWLRINKLLSDILGYSEDELLGQTFGDITYPGDLALYGEFNEELLQDKRPFYQVENRYIHKNGSVVWARVTVSLVRDSAQKPVYKVCQIEDIRERKRLEARLDTALKEAVDASRLKSEFLAHMSHEIRTPMNGVIGMITLLLDTPLTPDQQEMARVVQSSSDSLLGIINDILDFSKIEAGKLRIETAAFDLREVLEETLALLAPRAHEKGLELIDDFDFRLPSGMVGDGGRIRQVVTNLVGNAIKFTARGEVVVTTKQLMTHEKGVCFRVEVKDSGIGVPEKAQKLLFTAFEQGDSGTTRKFGGTGLGLAISRQLIELMGGKIGFESTPGVGSLFWFEIELPSLPQPSTEMIASLNTSKRVLVVDDNATNRRILVECVERMGFIVRAAGSATEAWSVLAATDLEPGIELVILDWHMPEIDGALLAQQIRQDLRYARLPIIMLGSALGDDQKANPANVTQTLIKPVRPAQLSRALIQALAGMRSASCDPGLIPRAKCLCRILLADDNPTNQLVGRMLLEKMGHVVTVVGDGLQAIAALRYGEFDLIFMDCQMPGLDGYEATRKIRSGAAGPQKARLPIVALTAYAMASDRTKCLEAGMDDYVSKPLRVEDVSEAVIRMTTNSPRSKALRPADGSSVPFDPTPLTQFLGMSNGGEPVVKKFLEIFERDEPKHRDAIRTALLDRNAKVLAAEAHSIAGTCGTLGGTQVRLRARAVEEAANQADWPALPLKIAALESAIQRFREQLQEFTSKVSS